MRKSYVALLLISGAVAALASNAFARSEELGGDDAQAKLINAQMVHDLRTAVARPGVASTGDTTYVGFVPGKSANPANYWSIGKGNNVGYPRATADYGVWTWDNDNAYRAGPPGPHNNNIGDVHGDSLYGWWPYRNLYTSTGGLTLPDDQRPWWGIDIGNNANYVINQGPGLKRTFGVVGVWHEDAGNTGGGAGKGVAWKGSDWPGHADNNALWCGLRRHGDLTVIDAVASGGTGNPLNSQVLANSGVGDAPSGTGAIGTNQQFPGYGSQWDQLAYQDVDVTNKASVTLRFRLRTNMSTSFGTAAGTRTGWFDKDPLGPADNTNVNALNNYISSSAAGAGAPIDSFMVYVGAGVGYAKGSSWKASDGNTYTIYDPQRRWLSETLRVNERPTVPYYEVFTTYGNNDPAKDWGSGANGTVVTKTATVSASWNNKARIVFRNKTNRGFDDEGGGASATSYSSLGRGAVEIDDVDISYDGGSTFSSLITFDTAGDVDNRTSVDPLNAMKTTGKPEGVFDHVHNINDLIYEDLCGLPGAKLRVCNMDGNVISSGDHDHSERAGGVFGTANQELNNSFFSPTIQLVNHNSTNLMDINPAIADVSNDYYINYEIYTGIFDFTSQGNAWRFAFSAFPAKQKDTSHIWSAWRFPGFIIFNPDKQCFSDIEGGYQNALIKFDAAGSEDAAFGFYPDSIRIMLGKVQQCFRFGLPSANCSPTSGAYWDNVSFTCINGTPAPMSIDIWQLINDTFTVNGGLNRSVVLPGTPAFDTTTALVKTGLNISQTTNTTTTRYDVPGDTTAVNADDVVPFEMHMVFRVSPGPGNYTSIGNASSSLRRVPTSTTPVDISSPVPGPNANFWEQYLINNGVHGTAGGHPAGGVNGGKVWSKLVWNSARMDTAETNLYQINSRLIGGAVTGDWATMYNENDPKFTILGIEKNRCFLKTATSAVTQANTTCDLVNNPTDGWEITSGYTTENGLAHGHTFEYTKIMPDGQFTPGTHVEYFIARYDGIGSGGPCDPGPCLAPDTMIVFPQNLEGSLDAHRWQEFSVLPDAWKYHGGLGMACMLYVDAHDRRGDERVWVSIADSIGATNAAKYGAHNGWHAPGSGTAAVNDPANFVRNLNDIPGTTWDMFGTKASESLNTKAGTIGAWNSYHASGPLDFHWSYQGPTIGMLEAYYKIMLILTGDLNSVDIGPGLNLSNNDCQMIQDFLAGGSSGAHVGVFIEGNGFVESAGPSGVQHNLLANWFKVSLRDPSYLTLTTNDNLCVDLVPSLPISSTDIYGVENGCLFTDDVLQVEAGGAQSARYSPNGSASGPVVAGVFHDVQGSENYQTVVDGWDVRNLYSRYCQGPRGRQWYYFQVLTNIFGKICPLLGSGGGVNDVPQGGAQEFVDFMNLRNNPLVAGQATVELGVSKADRVEVKVFDVSGRLVRTLADRQFAPGKYTLTWDGVDNSGRQVARGVFFTQVRYVGRNITDARKLTVLK